MPDEKYRLCETCSTDKDKAKAAGKLRRCDGKGCGAITCVHLAKHKGDNVDLCRICALREAKAAKPKPDKKDEAAK